jgi:hypothetical protein
MSSYDLIVKTTIHAQSQSQIWDCNGPMAFGKPFRWILERTNSGVRIRDLQGDVYHVNETDLMSGATVKIPGNKAPTFHLKPVNFITPPYLAQGAQTNVLPKLFAYGGVRRSLLSCQQIHSAYVAYERGKPTFALYHDAQGLRVKTLASGVRLKLKGQKPVLGNVGEVWSLPKEDLYRITLFKGWHWWRFNLVQNVSAISGEIRDLDSDGLKFKRHLFGLIGLFALTAGVGLYVTPKHQEDKVAAEAPVVSLKPNHLFKKQKQAPLDSGAPAPVIQNPEPAKVAEAAPQKAVAPVVKPEPVVHQAAAPHVAAPDPNAKKAKDMKSFLSKFKGVTSTSGLLEAGASSNSAKDTGLFTSTGTGVAKTEVKPLMSGGDVQVEGVGGKGTGYAEGSASGAVGTGGSGGSFVQMGGNGYRVDEGLTRDEVGSVIHSHMGEIRYCHEAALLQNPKTEGKLMMTFEINGRGVVKSATMDTSQLTPGALAECVHERLMTWQFPKPRGGVTVNVTYPFSFRVLEKE